MRAGVSHPILHVDVIMAGSFTEGPSLHVRPVLSIGETPSEFTYTSAPSFSALLACHNMFIFFGGTPGTIRYYRNKRKKNRLEKERNCADAKDENAKSKVKAKGMCSDMSK